MKKPNINEYQGIIFDLDGTLIDSLGFWREADLEFLEKNGIQLTLQDKELIRLEHPPHIDYKWGQFLIENYDIKVMSAEDVANTIYEIALNKFRSIRYKPFVLNFLSTIKRGGKSLAIVTNSPKSIIDVLRYENSHTTEINTFFGDYIVTSDMVIETKPASDGYHMALKMLQLNPYECLVFEDSIAGAKSAINADIDTCVVNDKFSDKNREELLKLTPFHIEHFGELLSDYSGCSSFLSSQFNNSEFLHKASILIKSAEITSVIGDWGMGKSTFSKSLSAITMQNLFHLEKEKYSPSGKQRPLTDFLKRYYEALNKGSCIFDGNAYSKDDTPGDYEFIMERLRKSDVIVFFDGDPQVVKEEYIKRTVRVESGKEERIEGTWRIVKDKEAAISGYYERKKCFASLLGEFRDKIIRIETYEHINALIEYLLKICDSNPNAGDVFLCTE